MYEEIKIKFQKLETDMGDQAIISDSKKYADITRQHSDLREVMAMISKLEEAESQLAQSRTILAEEKDEELLLMAQEEITELEKSVNNLKEAINLELKPKDPFDSKNAIIEIRAGTGGDESALFAADLFRMYSRFAERYGFKIQILSSNDTEMGGFKEIILSASGKNAYGTFKYERGIHRVQRVPETEKQGRIHTSAASVAVLPEAEEVDLQINPADLRIDTFCSSGPGGQSVNTTYSAIRITHIPSGTVVSCQDQKSQHQNKEKALQILRSRILARMEEEQQMKDSAERKQQIGTGDRSEKIRTYNFPQDRVTDHRIKITWHSIDRIMDGEIQEIINTLKKAA
jgi:peptide chain release factor 1